MNTEPVLCAVLDHLNDVPSLVDRKELPGLLAGLKDLLQRILATEPEEEHSSLTVELMKLCRKHPRLRQVLRETAEKYQNVFPTRSPNQPPEPKQWNQVKAKAAHLMGSPEQVRYVEIDGPITMKQGSSDTITLHFLPIGDDSNPKISMELVNKHECFRVSFQVDTTILVIEPCDHDILLGQIGEEHAAHFGIHALSMGTSSVTVSIRQYDKVVAEASYMISVREEADRSKFQETIELTPKTPFLVPADLYFRVTETPGRQGMTYLYHLYSHGDTDFPDNDMGKVTLNENDLAQRDYWISKLNGLCAGSDLDGKLIIDPKKVVETLDNIGDLLFNGFLSPELKDAYPNFREWVSTLHISSNESHIPWQLIKPFYRGRFRDIDEDFWGGSFTVTRWLRNGRSPAPELRLKQLAFVDGGNARQKLPSAISERQFLNDFAKRHNIEINRVQEEKAFEAMMEEGGVDWWHCSAHGGPPGDQPPETAMAIERDSLLRCLDVRRNRASQLYRDRPLVFMNVCYAALGKRTLGNMEGWVGAFVERARCGAFAGLEWSPSPELAFHFLTVFYTALEEGHTIGEASAKARDETRDAGRRDGDPSWSAFSIYAHPSATVAFGERERQESPCTLNNAR